MTTPATPIVPLNLGNCLRWRTGKDPTNSHRCRSCGLGPCLNTDSLSTSGGRRRKKRKKRQPVGDGYPRVRTKAEVEQWPVYKVGSLTSIDPVTSEFYYMHEYRRLVKEGVEVFNFHCTSPRDDSDLVSSLNTPPHHLLVNGLHDRIREAVFSVFMEGSDADGNFFPPLGIDDKPWSYAEPSRVRAMQAMRPSLETGFSLLNFLYELKDFKSWFDGSDLRSVSRSLSGITTRDASRTLSELGNLAALGQLTWSFAIKPLFSDIEKIILILVTFQSRTQRFIDDSHQLEVRRHFGANVEGTALLERINQSDLMKNVLLEEDYNSYVNLRLRLEPQARNISVTPANHWRYQATMDFDYTVHQLVEMNSQLGGLLQQLGVKPDASIIWNMIPFSFLVDWFVRVGDWLGANYSVDVMSALLTVHDWVESYRLRCSVDIHSLDIDPAHGWANSAAPLSTVAKVEVYLRRSVSPPDLESWGALDVDQGLEGRQVLALSLLKRLSNK